MVQSAHVPKGPVLRPGMDNAVRILMWYQVPMTSPGPVLRLVILAKLDLVCDASNISRLPLSSAYCPLMGKSHLQCSFMKILWKLFPSCNHEK